MFINATSFSAAASRFPLFSSAIVILLSIYVGFKYLFYGVRKTANVNNLVSNLVAATTEEVTVDDESDKPATKDNKNCWVLTLLILVFAILSYVIGIFYSSLVFMTLYATWRERRWYETAAMIIMTYLTGRFFFIVLDVNLHTGIIDMGEILW
jgi:fatty acid desaturase